MMNENEIKLQAYLDGEMSPAERAHFEVVLAADAELTQAMKGFVAVTEVLRAGEIKRALPETREFFWSKIERQINAETKHEEYASPARLSLREWLRRNVASLTVGAVAACLVAALFLTPSEVEGRGAEMELASDDMGSYTFRDPQEQVTMVWLYDRTSQDESQPAATEVTQ